MKTTKRNAADAAQRPENTEAEEKPSANLTPPLPIPEAIEKLL